MSQDATLRRAQKESLKALGKLDKKTLKKLQFYYKSGLNQLIERFGLFADDYGHVRIEQMSLILQEIETTLDTLYQQRQTLLSEALHAGAETGVPIVQMTGVSDESIAAVRAVIGQTQADKLDLSQRLWRLKTTEKKAIVQDISLALVRGDSAFKAARDFIENGVSVPANLSKEMAIASLNNLSRIASKSLMTGEGNALYNAQRLFRTEINRAHTLAYIKSVDGISGVIGYKFNLSSSHKRVDICDLHAKANLYGLGPGGYPKDVIMRIYPAHPQTTSYVTAIFDDKLSETDKKKDKNRISWLKNQSNRTQEAILGKQKALWLREGRLTERTINSRVRDLKKRFN